MAVSPVSNLLLLTAWHYSDGIRAPEDRHPFSLITDLTAPTPAKVTCWCTQWLNFSRGLGLDLLGGGQGKVLPKQFGSFSIWGLFWVVCFVHGNFHLFSLPEFLQLLLPCKSCTFAFSLWCSWWADYDLDPSILCQRGARLHGFCFVFCWFCYVFKWPHSIPLKVYICKILIWL